MQLQKLKDDITAQKELVTNARGTEKKANEHLKDIQMKLSVSTCTCKYMSVHVFDTLMMYP